MSRSQVTVLEDTSWERLWSGEVYRLIGIVRPWLTLGLALGAGWLTHRLWGHLPALPWAVIGLTLACVGLSVFAWATSRLVTAGRVHSTVTITGVMGWLTVATVTGPVAPVTGYLLAVAGGALALSWNLRHHARRADPAGTADPAGRLAGWFRDAAAPAGLAGARMQVRQVEPTRAAGRLILPPGERVASDAVGRARHIESGMKLPPGSLTIAEDPDRADHAVWTLSDPRAIRNPVPWPGPSAPGDSIARPLRPGIWQDGVPVTHTITGHHLHVMGMSGAGKSLGAGWNYMAELVTRHDVALAVADITKGQQTFGPLAPAIHRFETGRDGVRDLLERTHGTLKDRTDFLASRGLQKWREGCGLAYLVVWLEETPDIYDALTGKGQDKFLSTVKALRSAGGTIVVSLQRNTFDQLPTIIRGQMASLCFGLGDPADARYGLSDKQQDAGAEPAQWGTDHPGMAYLHAPDTPADRIAMPLRTYAWGEDSAAIAAHAAQYPAAARPVDDLTAAVVGRADLPPAPAPGRELATLTRPPAPATRDDYDDETDDDMEDADVCAEYLATPDPDPGLTADIDDPIEVQADDEPFDFVPPVRMEPEAARAELADELAAWVADGREMFAPRDLRAVMDRTGMGRAWIQARLREALDDPDGPVWREDEDAAGVYRLRQPLVGSAATP